MAERLTAETFAGVWVPIMVPWDEHYQLDEALYRENLRRLVAAGVHGIYTGGSTGEGYSLDELEARRVVDIMLEEVVPSGIATQAACYDVSTAKTIQRLKRLADTEVGAAQVAMPFWMKLTEKEMLGFWSDLSRACPDLPLVIYDAPATGWHFRAADYQRIKEVAPTLIGSKCAFANDMEGLLEAIDLNPDISYVIRIDEFVEAYGHGARAGHLIAHHTPEIPLKVCELVEDGQLEEAEVLAQRARKFVSWSWSLAVELGAQMHDSTYDKGISTATGFWTGHQRTRPPYIGWSDEMVQTVREQMEQEFPDFVVE